MPEALKNIHISQKASCLTIRWKRGGRAGHWLSEVIWFLVGLAFFGFPVFGLVSQAIQGKLANWGWGNLVTVPFALLGGLALYRTLTLLINTDVIEVTPQTLRVRSGPLPPWDMETPTIPRQEITQVTCQVRTLSTRGRSNMRGTDHNYDVYAIAPDGKARAIITGSRQAEPAHFVANEITRFLKELH